MYKIKNLIYGFFVMSIVLTLFYFVLIDTFDIDISLPVFDINQTNTTNLNYNGLGSVAIVLGFFLVGTISILHLSLYQIKTSKKINFMNIVFYIIIILIIGYVLDYLSIAITLICAFLFSLLMTFIYYSFIRYIKDKKIENTIHADTK